MLSMNPRVVAGLLVVSLGAGLGASPAGAAAYHVLPDSSGDAATIQEALYLCFPGDSVLVEPGTYRDLWKDLAFNYNNVLMVDGVVLKSTQGPELTILDATADSTYNPELIAYTRRGAFLNNCGPGTVIEGFTIRGGHDAVSSSAGMRILGGSPRILNNIFVDLYGGMGGSIKVEPYSGATPVISGNRFDNSFTCCGMGGAIFVGDGCIAEVRNNVFDSDSTQFAGAAVAFSNAGGVIADNQFISNSATNGGGALSIANFSSPEVYGNTFVGNLADSTAGNGGAVVYQNGSTGSFHDNVILGSVADAHGGAIYIEDSSPAISHCTIYDNASGMGAGGIHIAEVYGESSPTFDAVLVTSNHGSGGVSRTGTTKGTVSFTASNFYDNEGGDFVGLSSPVGTGGNKSLDPRFCAGSEPSLEACSPFVGPGETILAGAPVDVCPCTDATSPNLVIGVLQNPVVTSAIDIYVASDEVLAAIPVITAAGAEVEAQDISTGGLPVSRARYALSTAGTVAINATATDLGANEGSSDFVFVSFPVGREGGRSATPDGALTLEVPSGTLDSPRYLTLYRADGSHEASKTLPARYEIGPAGLALGGAEVRIDLAALGYSAAEASRFGIYLEHAAEWTPLESYHHEGGSVIFARLPHAGSIELRQTEAGSETLPAVLLLRQNEPNPFSSRTSIRYDLPRASDVALRVFDVEGRLVRTLVSGMTAAGRHDVHWDGRDDAGRAAAPGIYSYRLTSGDGVESKKMLLLR